MYKVLISLLLSISLLSCTTHVAIKYIGLSKPEQRELDFLDTPWFADIKGDNILLKLEFHGEPDLGKMLCLDSTIVGINPELRICGKELSLAKLSGVYAEKAIGGKKVFLRVSRKAPISSETYIVFFYYRNDGTRSNILDTYDLSRNADDICFSIMGGRMIPLFYKSFQSNTVVISKELVAEVFR